MGLRCNYLATLESLCDGNGAEDGIEKPNLVVVLVVVALVVEVLLVVVFVVFVVVEDVEAETTLPSGEQGKSRSAVDSILVQ